MTLFPAREENRRQRRWRSRLSRPSDVRPKGLRNGPPQGYDQRRNCRWASTPMWSWWEQDRLA